MTPEYSMLVQRIAEAKNLRDSTTYDMQDGKNFYVAAPIVHDGFTLGTPILAA